MREFKVNEKVNHTTLGEGTVIEIVERKGSHGEPDLPIVKVQFKGQAREVEHTVFLNANNSKTVREISDVYEFRPDTLEEHLA